MPTINKGSDYFGVLTYTGDGAASKTVVDTSAVTFQPDFVWIKSRSGATDHALYDAVRGTTKDLVSNSTAAETTQSTGLTSFVNGGFTIGNLAKLNTSGATYTAWCWKANGAGSSNTNGSITSTVSVNTTAGFSIVTYTGNGTAGATVGHGLGVAPSMVIIKNRTAAAQNWLVWHKSISQAIQTSSVITLNGYTGSTLLNGTGASFTYAFDSQINGSTNSMLAYCWAEIAGFSKFGSYTGNGSTDGVFVYTGFRPKYIMVKRTTGTVYAWCVWDSARETYNVENAILTANTSNAENTGTLYVDFLSNGFKFRSYSNGSENASGEPYIYAAFAESPFKISNSR
jgi:hypothetical protein